MREGRKFVPLTTSCMSAEDTGNVFGAMPLIAMQASSEVVSPGAMHALQLDTTCVPKHAPRQSSSGSPQYEMFCAAHTVLMVAVP